MFHGYQIWPGFFCFFFDECQLIFFEEKREILSQYSAGALHLALRAAQPDDERRAGWVWGGGMVV